MGILDGFFASPLHSTEGVHRNEHALFRQLLHQLHKTLAFFWPQQVAHRHANVIEEQLASILALHADLLERCSHR
ncbi:hypothetical protein D3C80_1999550 [compost metagenome]